MDEYVIGSVADLISNKKCSKVKSQKEKPQIPEPFLDVDSLTKNKFSSNSEKKKHKSSESHSFKENLNIETLEPKKESTVLKTKSKLVKKRKKLPETIVNATDADGEPELKKQKEDLSKLQHGENVDKGNIGKNLNKGKKFPRVQKSLQDFTENTVFVGNIPLNYDKKKIFKIFTKFGEIQSARIRCVPIAEINMNKKVAAIKKQYNPKRNSLVAYVKFKSQDSATAALKANGMVVDGHHLRVDAAGNVKNRDNSKAVFVGGLPFDIEDDELWEFFKNCGQIESVRIIRDSQTSMGKGFGYVNFDSSACVELALQLDGQELKNRKINVKRCIKTKNKNKLNSFGMKESNEITNKLLCKKGKKFKEEKKKLKKGNKFSVDFQGRTAHMKHKKKKKLSKAALHQRKLVKILGAS